MYLTSVHSPETGVAAVIESGDRERMHEMLNNIPHHRNFDGVETYYVVFEEAPEYLFKLTSLSLLEVLAQWMIGASIVPQQSGEC